MNPTLQSPAAFLRAAARPRSLIWNPFGVFLIVCIGIVAGFDFGLIMVAYLAPPLAAIVAWLGALRHLTRLSGREHREEISLTGLPPEATLLPAAVARLGRPFLQAAACIVLVYPLWVIRGSRNIDSDMGRYMTWLITRLPVNLGTARQALILATSVILSATVTLGLAAQSVVLTAAGLCNTLALMCRRRNARRLPMMEFALVSTLWGAVGAFGPLGGLWLFLFVCGHDMTGVVTEEAPIALLTPGFLAVALAVEGVFLGWSWRRLCGVYYRFED